MKQAEAKLVTKILSATFNANSELKFALGRQMDPSHRETQIRLDPETGLNK